MGVANRYLRRLASVHFFLPYMVQPPSAKKWVRDCEPFSSCRHNQQNSDLGRKRELGWSGVSKSSWRALASQSQVRLRESPNLLAHGADHVVASAVRLFIDGQAAAGTGLDVRYIFRRLQGEKKRRKQLKERKGRWAPRLQAKRTRKGSQRWPG